MWRVTRPLTLIVDTASLYFRAYYGVPTNLVNAEGQPINALHGLLDMLARLVERYEPAELVCAWDDDWRPQWRVDLVPSYKTHRLVAVGDDPAAEEAPDELARQVPWIVDCLEAAGICIAGVAGYEADDVAGTLARRAVGRGGRSIVVTGDRDLFQLVGQDSQVAYVARGVAKHELVDDAWLAAKYQIRGDQYIDFATLRGDASDGLPGVAGIGEKTAALLLNTYGDLAGLQAAAADPASGLPARQRERLLAAADYLAAARPVVATAEVDLGELDCAVAPGRADIARCTALAELHNSRGPMRRLLTALGEPNDP